MRIRQSNHIQNEVNFDPSIGSSHRDNPPSPTNGSSSGERFLDNQSGPNNNLSHQENSNIVNHTNAGATTFPSPRQSSQEMDHSIIVEPSSMPTSDIHVDVNSEPDFISTSSLMAEIRSELEFRHELLEHLRAGGSLQVEARSVRLDEDNVNPDVGLDEEENQNEADDDDDDDDGSMWLTGEEIMTSIRHETIEFAGEDTAEKEELCEICQEGYAKGDKVGRLDCSHKFHIGCIYDWLVRKNICPKCRRMALLPIYVDYTP